MERFQFSMRSGLIAMFWIVVWFAAVGHGPRMQIALPWMFVLVMAPAAAFGAAANHHALGILCGSCSGVAFILWHSLAK